MSTLLIEVMKAQTQVAALDAKLDTLIDMVNSIQAPAEITGVDALKDEISLVQKALKALGKKK